MTVRYPLISAAAIIAVIAASAARGSNAELQDLFFVACNNATSQLAERCAQTDGGLGDLSGDSESSLNPSQVLGTGTSGEAASRLREQHGQTTGAQAPDGHSLRADFGALSLLVNVSGSEESFDRVVDVDEERSYEARARAAQLGLDYRLSDRVVIGALAHWQSTTLDFSRERPGINFAPIGRAGEISSDSFGASVFASMSLGDASYLELLAGGLRTDMTVERRALFQESRRQVPTTAVSTRASTDADEWFAGIRGGTSFSVRGWQIGPYGGLDYLARSIDGYQEQDLSQSGLALDVSGSDYRETRAFAGLQASVAWSLNGFVLLPELRAEYVRHLDQDRTGVRVSFAEDAASSVLNLTGDTRDDGYFEFGVGVSAILPGGGTVFAQWRGVTGRDSYDRSNLALGLRAAL